MKPKPTIAFILNTYVKQLKGLHSQISLSSASVTFFERMW